MSNPEIHDEVDTHQSSDNPSPSDTPQPSTPDMKPETSAHDTPQFRVKKPSVFGWLKWLIIIFFTSIFWVSLQIIGYIFMPILAFLAARLWAKTGKYMINKLLFAQLANRHNKFKGGLFSRLLLLSYTGYDKYYVEPLIEELDLNKVLTVMKKRGLDVLISNVGIAFTFTWLITLPFNLETLNPGTIALILITGIFLASFGLSLYLPFAWILQDSGFKSYNPKTYEVKLISKGFKNRLDRVFGLSGIFAAGDVITRLVANTTNASTITQFASILLIFFMAVFFVGGQSLLAALIYLIRYHPHIVNETRQRLIQDPEISLAHTIIQSYSITLQEQEASTT